MTERKGATATLKRKLLWLFYKSMRNNLDSVMPSDLKLLLLLFGLYLGIYPHVVLSKAFDIFPSPISKALDSKSVMEMLKDSRGYLWIRNHTGLHRFDGQEIRQMHVYGEVDFQDEPSSTKRLAEDQKGNVWFASYDKGLLVYDHKSRRFQSFASQPYDRADSAYTVFHDGMNSLWVGTDSGELLRIDTRSRVQYSDTSAARYLNENERIISFSYKSPDTLWMATSLGSLLRCNPQGRECKYLHISEVLGNQRNWYLQSLLVQDDGSVMLSFFDGTVYLYFPDEDSASLILEGHNNSGGALAQNNTNLFISSTGDVWLGTKTGLLRLQKERKPEVISGRNFRFSDGLIYSFEEVDQENLLVSSFNGIHVVSKPAFRHFGESKDLPSRNVSTFAQRVAGQIIVGTLGGIAILDVASDQLFLLKEQYPSLNIKGQKVTTIQSINEEIWLGFYSNGVQRFDSFFSKELPVQDSLIKKPLISDFALLNDEIIVVSTYGSGVLFFDNKGNLIPTNKERSPSSSKNPPAAVYCIEAMQQDRIAAGTVEGLAVIEIDRTSTNLLSIASSNHYLRDHRIYSLRLTSKGDVYAGTGSAGVYRWRSALREDREPLIERVITSPPLPDQTIYAIEEDDQGMLWMSTNKGLVRLNPANDHITIFDRSDGLQDDEFNIGSSFKDSSGNLYFGGINGFNKFNPKDVKIKREPPRINVTEIKITNTPVSYDPGYTDIPELVLRHDDHSIDFEFSNMDLVSPGRGHYKYMLQNFDSDWIDIGNRNTATYTSLPSGSYRFRVVGANADGVWNYDGVSIPLRVLPAPWFTWWAFTAYGLAALAVLLFVKRFYDVSIIKEEATRQASVMTSTATRAMDELQDQLFVERRLVGNVRKHAALTIDTIEEMMAVESEDLGGGVSDEPLRRTRQRLHCLKALEQGVCFHADRLEVNFRDVADAIFQEVMADAPPTDCEIVFANDSIERLIPVEIATALTLIAHELVLNSVTHAFEGAEGVQVVVVSLKENTGSPGWSLEVADSGCGLPDNVDPLQPTTLGMELVTRHARRLGASFEVNVDQGTRYRFQVPAPAAKHPSRVFS